MKRKLVYAMGLTAMMAACSSEDVLTDVQNSQELDLFAGIEKVEANFGMGIESRLANKWNLEIGDLVGLAWMNDGTDGVLETTGVAYQNHPLYEESGDGYLKPKTSIYVGEYFAYAPYDKSVVGIEEINFSLAEEADMLSTWNGLANKAIYISPRWTTVTKDGLSVDGKAGIDNNFTIYPRKFSNGVLLDFTYKNHSIDLRDETDDYKSYESDAEIFDAKVSYVTGDDDSETVLSINKFQYAPVEQAVSDEEWESTVNPITSWEGFALAEDVTCDAETASLNPRSAEEGGTLSYVVVKSAEKGEYTLVPSSQYEASRELTGGKFYMNALPAMTEVNDGTEVKIVLSTTYGWITIKKPVNEIAKTTSNGTRNYFDGVTVGGDGAALEEGEYTPYTKSFVQVLGKNGKFETEVDFSTVVMDGMHVKDDAHLIKLLRYYRDKKMTGDYAESGVDFYLDEDADGEFKISKTAIALAQSVNADVQGTGNVALHVCTEHGNPTVVVFNDGTDTEVPALDKVFGDPIDVELAEMAWTWDESTAKATSNVKEVNNRGNLTVTSTNVEISGDNNFRQLVNLRNATITFTASTATLWKVDLTNHGVITIPATAHMRVYSKVVNDVTSVSGVRTGVMGVVNNSGVFGAIEGSEGTVTNYGMIKHSAGAKTFVTENALNENFADEMSDTNKIGIIEMENADANVSVSNATTQGIITWTWNGEGTYETPEVARYNYLIVKNNITFGTEAEKEIRYLEIAGGDVYVNNKKGVLKNLEAVIVDSSYALNITEGNKLKPSKAAYIKGYVYNGGEFAYNNDVTTYFGGNEADKENIVQWTGK